MALHALTLNSVQVTGSGNTNGFACIQNSFTSPPAIADVAQIQQGIVDDQAIISALLATPSATTIQAGLIFTASLAAAPVVTLTSVTFTSPAGAAIAQVAAGMVVSGPGLAPGSKVISTTSTTIVVDRNSVASATAQTYICAVTFQGGFDGKLLTIPNRGVLKVLPGDVVFLDNFGFPYLAPATSLGATGPWTFT